MAEGPNPDEKEYVTAPTGGGLAPTYFTGTASKSDVPYSKGAKLVGYIVVACIVLFMVWFVVSWM